MSRFSAFVVLALAFVGVGGSSSALSGQSMRVIPDGQSVMVMTDSTISLDYGVEYIAPVGYDTIDVVLTCLESIGSCVTISPSSLRLGPNQMANVTVQFTAPASKGTGDVILEAVGDAMETLSDFGTINIDARLPYDIQVIHLTNETTYDAGAQDLVHSFEVVNTGYLANTFHYSICRSTYGVAAGCLVSADSSGVLTTDASHVVGEEGEAKVWVEPGIELARNHGLPDKTLNAAMDLIKEREDEIRKAWEEHFGR